MINGVNAGIIVGIVILETTSQFLAKKFYDAKWNNGKLWYILLSFLLYAPILYLLIRTYDYSRFAISNAFWDSGTVIGTTLVGYFFFGETFVWQELVGLGLVITGAILLGVYSEDVSKS
jgi:small multidrug resistance pump